MAYTYDENGKYKRTVRCGYFYEVGHNKSACPKRKQDLKSNIERYKRELTENNWPEDDWQRRNTERYLSQAQDALHKMENRGKNRRCSYCQEPGHTKRTCPDRKKEISAWTKTFVRQRNRYARAMAEAGFGVGALVEVNYARSKRLALVTGINMSEIRPENDIDERRSTYWGGPKIVTLRLCKAVRDDFYNQDVVDIKHAKLPVDIHNFDNRDIRERDIEFRSQENGWINKVIGPVDVSAKSLCEMHSMESIKKLAVQYTDDKDSYRGKPEEICVYET